MSECHCTYGEIMRKKFVGLGLHIYAFIQKQFLNKNFRHVLPCHHSVVNNRGNERTQEIRQKEAISQ